ncbi:MAG: aspartate aminotransferase family protein [Gaiellales bacterium]
MSGLSEFQRISRTVAGGESSYARLRAGAQIVVERAAGPHIWDTEGRRYLDYCGGYGVNLFGHNPAFVWDEVERVVAELGVHVALPHRLYGDVGELVAGLVPGIEQLRYANSGTEATQAAVRLARAATGRELIVKFEGHYHGWADHLIAGWGGGSAGSHPRPDSPGVPASSVDALVVVPWNDPPALRDALAAAGDRLAGAVCEVVVGSGGLVCPAAGYLAEMAETVREAGGLVVFDEVMTGFRLAPGGAQQLFGVTPDITVLGKIIGGGFALAAFGGSRELMRIEAEGGVVHGGTYTGSPVALAASRAVLSRIAGEQALYEELERRSSRLASGIEEAMAATGVPGHVRRVGSMLQPFFAQRPAHEPPDVPAAAALQDDSRYRQFCDALEARGVFCHRYPLGRWFLSTVHGDREVDETIEAVAGALEEVARV